MKEQKLNLPWLWASNLQNCEKLNFCCLSHPVCGILLQQLKLTNTVSNAWCLENTDIPSVFSETSFWMFFKCSLSLETGFDLPVICFFVWLWFLLKGNLRLHPIWPSFYHRYVTIWFSIFSFNISCNYRLFDFSSPWLASFSVYAEIQFLFF